VSQKNWATFTSVTVQDSTCTSCMWNCRGSASRNTRLHFSGYVASKQSRSQSSWLRDLGCHAASCIAPHTINELKQRLIVWCGLEQSTVNMAIVQWRRLRACVRAKGGHFEHSLW